MSIEDPTGPLPDPEEFRSGELFRVAWAFYLVLAVVGVVWLGIANGSLTLGLFLDPDRIFVDLAAGVGSAAGLVGGWRWLRRYLASMRRLESVMRPWFASIDSSEVFVLALLSGFSEELFFRGALQTSLGWIWATLIFTLLHSGPARIFRVWTLFALVAGLLFAGLTIWSGNLLAAVVAHFLVNWINLRSLLQGEDPEPTSSA